MTIRAALALILVLASAPLAASAQDAPPQSEQRSREAIEDHVRQVLRERMQGCWRMPAGIPNPEQLVITVEFNLNEDGSLDGQPRITSPRTYQFDIAMRDAARAALEAVRRCAPYPFADDPLTADHYETWRELEMTFRPPAASRAPH